MSGRVHPFRVVHRGPGVEQQRDILRGKGHRVVVPHGDHERLFLAQVVARRLSPERVRQLRLLADHLLLEDAMRPADETQDA